MTEFKWKITETVIKDEILKSLKYYCKATDGDLSVETEGYWTMKTPHEVSRETSESQVIHWLDLETSQDGNNIIESRLQEQLDNLRNPVSTQLPWAVPTFKVTL
ncbi:MAG: hypothetical protein EBT07_15645 [Actinobacteria bacterium]|nr:hypothetical protein [Actinomycetota bacterium]